MPAIGEVAPDFELLNQDGETVRLGDLRGRRVILFAYPKAATPGCTTQACGFRDNYRQVEAGDALVLGLSPDEPPALRQWIDDENFPFDLLSDPQHEVLEAWGAWGERTMYGNKYMGVIRSHWVIGADGVIEDEQLNVSPKNSVKRALAAL
ncbi:MAG: peroxiredoxin [Anaerolineae bacterium]|nr:peroxiredoxin [Anaerolineae bacterium]